MNVKIQGGGGGNYANSGSSIGAVNYLEHEDVQRIKEGQEIEPFFNQKGNAQAKEVSYNLDKNKAKLMKSDSKFYVMTVSPSKEEINAMGATPEEQTAKFKEFINKGIMERYAENFGKNLKAENLMYYAKIHHTRGEKEGAQMHAHVIISRKDIDNKLKLSPQTNHKEGNKGIIKSGFNRDEFFHKCEKTFDKAFNFNRDIEQSYRYQNTLKNGTLEELKELTTTNKTHQDKEQHQEQNQEKKEQQQQEQEHKREIKKDRDFGMNF